VKLAHLNINYNTKDNLFLPIATNLSNHKPVVTAYHFATAAAAGPQCVQPMADLSSHGL
jgi:hypothetical protein